MGREEFFAVLKVNDSARNFLKFYSVNIELPCSTSFILCHLFGFPVIIRLVCIRIRGKKYNNVPHPNL